MRPGVVILDQVVVEGIAAQSVQDPAFGQNGDAGFPEVLSDGSHGRGDHHHVSDPVVDPNHDPPDLRRIDGPHEPAPMTRGKSAARDRRAARAGADLRPRIVPAAVSTCSGRMFEVDLPARRTKCAGPRGAFRRGSVGPNRATTGHPTPHARCIGPVSAPTNSAQRLRIAAKILKEVGGATMACPVEPEAIERARSSSPGPQATRGSAPTLDLKSEASRA